MYLTYFGTTMSDKHLEFGNRRNVPEKSILWIII